MMHRHTPGLARERNYFFTLKIWIVGVNRATENAIMVVA